MRAMQGKIIIALLAAILATGIVFLVRDYSLSASQQAAANREAVALARRAEEEQKFEVYIDECQSLSDRIKIVLHNNTVMRSIGSQFSGRLAAVEEDNYSQREMLAFKRMRSLQIAGASVDDIINDTKMDFIGLAEKAAGKSEADKLRGGFVYLKP